MTVFSKSNPFQLAALGLLTLLLACSPLAAESPPPTEPATVSAAPSVAATASPPPLPSPSPVPPATATPPPPPSPTPPESPASSEFEFDLAQQKQAMRAAFRDDVDTVAERGASRYRLTIDLNPASFDTPEGVQLQGEMAVQYTNTETSPLSEIYLRLYPNLPGYGGQMTVETVTVDGQPLTPELAAEDTALRLPLQAPLPPGESLTLALSYQALVPAQTGPGYNIFSYIRGVAALAGFYPAIAVYDDEGWNIEVPPTYGDATYLDTSFYEVELTVPAQMVVAASGSLLREQSNPDETKTVSFVSGPMRDFYLAMSAEYEVLSETVEGVTINSYYPPELAAGGELALSYSLEALRLFNRQFGPYPYAEFDIVATPTTAGGVEYPGVIVIAQGLYRQEGGFFEHVAAHEAAHQWWYAVVGNDQVDEPWLDESLTNYSALLYWQETAPEAAAAQIMEELFLAPYEQARLQGEDRSVLGPVAAFSPQEYGVFVYGKGPLFFRALRQEVGDQMFFEIMQTYYSEYKYRVAQSEDLFEVIETVSGQPVEPLRQTWLEAPP